MRTPKAVFTTAEVALLPAAHGTKEKAGRRAGSEQGLSAPPLSSCLPSPRFGFLFFTAFLGIYQDLWGLRGGKSSFRGGVGGWGWGWVVQNR